MDDVITTNLCFTNSSGSVADELVVQFNTPVKIINVNLNEPDADSRYIINSSQNYDF